MLEQLKQSLSTKQPTILPYALSSDVYLPSVALAKRQLKALA